MAGEDGVSERLRFGPAARAIEVGVLVEPGRVGGEVALRRSHLVDPPHHKLPWTHEQVGSEGGEVVVVRGCGVFGGPVLEEHVSGSGP